MNYINEFKTFVLNERSTKISPDRTSPSVWPSKLDDSPYWDILKSMGFTEKRILTQTGTFVIEAPDGQVYNLTKSGYLRTNPKYMLTYAGPQNIDGLFLYLIKRYLPSWKKKIGRNSNDHNLKILAKIQQLIDSEEKKLNLPNHPNLSAEQIKFLDLTCLNYSGIHSKWTYNNGEIDVEGDVILKKILRHPSYLGIGSLPKKYGIKFGHVKGNFIADDLNLKSMVGEGFPHTIDGYFSFWRNPIKNFYGAPQIIKGGFFSDLMEFKAGDLTKENIVNTFQKASPAQKKIMITLPLFDAEYWNSRISENPNITIIQLSELWDDMPDDVRNSIRIPPNLEDDFDNLVDLIRKGIM